MPDATIHAAVALNVGAASATIAIGTIFGVPYVVIGLALLGGAISHIYVTGLGTRRMLISIVGSTVLGVMAAECSKILLLGLAGHYAPWAIKALEDASVGGKVAIAFWVAFIAQKAVPVLFKWLDSKGGNA